MNNPSKEEYLYFWERVADLLIPQSGHGHPESWTMKQYKDFASSFEKQLVEISQVSPEKAKRLNINYRGKDISPDTLRRIFKTKKSSSHPDTRTAFCIYLGFDNYEDFKEQEMKAFSSEIAISPTKKNSFLKISIAIHEHRKVVAILAFLIISGFAFLFINSQTKPEISENPSTPKEEYHIHTSGPGSAAVNTANSSGNTINIQLPASSDSLNPKNDNHEQ